MPQTSGPYTPVNGEANIVNNPILSGGTVTSVAAVLVNLSSFELIIGSGASQTSGLIDPFTRDIVILDPEAGQQLTVTPLNIGYTGPIGITPIYYIIWYGSNDTLPTALPSPIVPYGNLQSVMISDQPIDVEISDQPIDVAGATGTTGALEIGTSAGDVVSAGVMLCSWDVESLTAGAVVELFGETSGTRYAVAGAVQSGMRLDKLTTAELIKGATSTGTAYILVRYAT